MIFEQLRKIRLLREVHRLEVRQERKLQVECANATADMADLERDNCYGIDTRPWLIDYMELMISDGYIEACQYHAPVIVDALQQAQLTGGLAEDGLDFLGKDVAASVWHILSDQCPVRSEDKPFLLGTPYRIRVTEEGKVLPESQAV